MVNYNSTVSIKNLCNYTSPQNDREIWKILTTYEHPFWFIAHPIQLTHAYIKYILVYFVFALASPHFEPALDTHYSYLAAH
jgi:hypothetical protein